MVDYQIHFLLAFFLPFRYNILLDQAKIPDMSQETGLVRSPFFRPMGRSVYAIF